MGLFDFLFRKTKKNEVETSESKQKKYEFEDPNLVAQKIEKSFNRIFEEPLKEAKSIIENYNRIDDKFEDLNILTSLNEGYKTTKQHTQTKKITAIQPTIQKSKFDFVAIDFETSNNNHSICSVAIVVVKDCNIIEEKEWLVKPSSPIFESRNISVHGISYETVKNAPMFPEVWEELKYYLKMKLSLAIMYLGQK